MTIVSDYVSSITDEDRLAIICGYEQLERDGSIGDHPIRVHTEALLKKHGIDEYSVVMWMTQLAFECYRYYADRVIWRRTPTEYALW